MTRLTSGPATFKRASRTRGGFCYSRELAEREFRFHFGVAPATMTALARTRGADACTLGYRGVMRLRG